jgi:hypothetical protein
VQNAQRAYVSAEAVAGAAGLGVIVLTNITWEIALHELAHLLEAPGFNQNDGRTNADGTPTQAAKAGQQANATPLQQKCPNLANH